VVRCTGAYLGLARSQRPRLVLAPVLLRVLAPHHLSQICEYETLHKCNAWGAKGSMLHDYAQLTHVNSYKLFTNLSLVF
jgi:hypothetical protein